MSWNIKTPGDYINGPLTVAGAVTLNSTLSIGGETRIRSGNQLRVYRSDNAIYSSIEDAGSGVGLVLNNLNGDGFRLRITGNNVYNVAGDGTYTQTWLNGAGSEWMRLNAIGLGIGVTPELKLRVNGPDEAPATSGTSTSNGALRIGGANTNLCIDSGVCTTGGIYGWFQSRDRSTYASNYDLVLQKNGGNVGIGVVPIGGKGCLQLSSGINFPATQVASTDANTLDDYEEGTFTASVEGSTTAGTATYVVRNSTYTKVGRLVQFQIHLAWNSGSGAGALRITGLPFTANGTYIAVPQVYPIDIALVAGFFAVASVQPGTGYINIYQIPTGGGSDGTVSYDAAGQLIVTGTYIV